MLSGAAAALQARILVMESPVVLLEVAMPIPGSEKFPELETGETMEFRRDTVCTQR